MKKINEKYYDFVISDFDGTLLSTKGTVSDQTISTINAFIKRGGVFSVCTGRMSGSILHLLRNLKLEGYVVSYNGAEICDIVTGEKLYKNHIDNQTAIKILQFAEENGFDLLVYPNDCVTVDHLNDRILGYFNLASMNGVCIDHKVSEYFKENNFTTGKALFLTGADERVINKVLTELPKIVGEDYNIIKSNDYHIDVMKDGVSKGDTVKILAKLMGKSLDKLICFGDEMNDESMLRVAGLSAVMQNGNPQLKEFCDVVVDSCDDDGVRKAIEKYCI